MKMTNQFDTCKPVHSVDNPGSKLSDSLWQNVLKYVTDPMDILNVSNTCRQFHNLLKNNEGPSSCRFEEVIPYVLPWLPQKDVLRCRNVCKSVTKCVDYVMDRVEQLTPYQNIGLLHGRFVPPQAPNFYEWKLLGRLKWRKGPHLLSEVTGVKLNSSDTLARFEREMQETSLQRPGGRPFVGKNLRLQLVSELEQSADELQPLDMDYFQQSLHVLSLFKSKIEYITYSLTYSDKDLIPTYEVVRTLLRSLPNLRAFCGEFMQNGEWVEEWEPQHVMQLQRYISSNPLPIMPSLEKISFFAYPLPAPFQQELAVRYGGQMKSYSMYQERFLELHHHETENYLTEPHQFPVLSQLKVAITWKMSSFPINIVSSSLSHLDLRYSDHEHPPQVRPMNQLLQILQHFPTLVSLRLEYLLVAKKNVPILPDDGDPTLGIQFSNVKHLRAIPRGGLLPLWVFSRLFPTLQSFRVNLRHNFCLDLDPTLQILSQSERMWESQLWTELPDLQKLTLCMPDGVNYCSRTQYLTKMEARRQLGLAS